MKNRQPRISAQALPYLGINQSSMRILYTLLLVSLLALLPWSAGAQTPEATFGQIENAIKASDAEALSKYFNNTVEVTIMDKDQDYPRQQAQFVLKDFFTSYPLRTFTIMHKGSSGDTWYAVGSYVSPRGSFDTNILLKKYGDKVLIQTLRFERDQ